MSDEKNFNVPDNDIIELLNSCEFDENYTKATELYNALRDSYLSKLMNDILKSNISEEEYVPKTAQELSDAFKKFKNGIIEEMSDHEDSEEDDNIEDEIKEKNSNPDDPVKVIQMLPEGCNPPRVREGDEIPDGFTTYHVNDTNRDYLTLCNSCLCCDHCTDVYLDYSGPYGFICTKGEDIWSGMIGSCLHFEDKDNEK